MKKMNEEINLKPTLNKPMSTQSKGYEKNFKNSMLINAPDVNLNEVDAMLDEAEQSLKKKIFSLPKMEALVFSDPKLSALYNQMAENGEEKYGYHYNETIMNMLFNDYVLNSPKYLQKYKMAIPKEKKRRDKSGINQLKKDGEKKMTQSGLLKQPKQPKVNPQPEIQETTGAASAGAFVPVLNVQKNVEESTSAGSAGGATGYVGYAGPAAWGGGDLLKKGKTAPALRKPIWAGGTVIQESNYLTDSSGFEEFIQMLEEDMDRMPDADAEILHNDITQQHSMFPHQENPVLPNDGISGANIVNQEKSKTKPFVGVSKSVRQTADNVIIDKTAAFTSDVVKGWNDEDMNIELNTLKTGQLDKPNLNLMEGSIDNFDDSRQHNEMKNINEKAKSQKQQQFMGMVHAIQKGDLSSKEVSPKMQKVAKEMKSGDVEDFAKTKHKGLPEKVDELANNNREQKIYYIERAYKRMTGNHYEDEMIFGDLYSLDDNKLHKIYVDMTKMLSSHGISPDSIMESNNKNMSEEFNVNEYVVTVKHDNGTVRIKTTASSEQAAKDKVMKAENCPQSAIIKVEPKRKIAETDQSMIAKPSATMANYATPTDDAGTNVPRGAQQTGGAMNEYLDAKYKQDDVYKYAVESKYIIGFSAKEDILYFKSEDEAINYVKEKPKNRRYLGIVSSLNEEFALLEELNNELNAFSIHQQKLMKMTEDRKPSSLVLKDRLGAENKKNFKSDLDQSGTKEVIDVQKELEWKDQQTNVDDPQKLNQDIEKKEIKTTDAEGKEHLKNVGDSANDKGDEIPKRNFTTEEQHEVDMMRNGMHSIVYDNETGKRFDDRMKADMGDDIYKMRQEQLAYKGKAPMYNKDSQPTDKGIDKVQFDKNKSGWNERNGLKESVLTGRYKDFLNKSHIVDFNLNEVKELKGEIQTGLFNIDFTGLGNSYESKSSNNKVIVNESAIKAIDSYKFYTNGKDVFAQKNSVQNINENEIKQEKPILDEQVGKMKHLLGYKPADFVNTNYVKKNRGF